MRGNVETSKRRNAEIGGRGRFRTASGNERSTAKRRNAETKAGLCEGVDDFEGRRRSATGEVLGVQLGYARFQARGGDHGIPERPLTLYVQNPSAIQHCASREDQRQQVEEFLEVFPGLLSSAMAPNLAKRGDELDRDLPEDSALSSRTQKVACDLVPTPCRPVTGIDQDVRVKSDHRVRREKGADLEFGSSIALCGQTTAEARPDAARPSCRQWVRSSGARAASQGSQGSRGVPGRRVNKWPQRLSSYLEYSRTTPPEARSVRQDDAGLSKTAGTQTIGPSERGAEATRPIRSPALATTISESAIDNRQSTISIIVRRGFG